MKHTKALSLEEVLFVKCLEKDKNTSCMEETEDGDI